MRLPPRRIRRRKPLSSRPQGVFSERKNPTKAIAILRLGQAANPESVAIHEWLGLAYQQAAQPNEAISAFEAALALPHTTSVCINGLAKLYTKDKRYDDAFRVLDTALTKANLSLKILDSLS